VKAAGSPHPGLFSPDQCRAIATICPSADRGLPSAPRYAGILTGNFRRLEAKLWRPKFDRYLDIERRRLLLHDFSAAAQWVDLPAMPRAAYSRDPDDDVFLHTALQSKAEWLVSGDTDLLELPPTDWGFEILSPAQALEL